MPLCLYSILCNSLIKVAIYEGSSKEKSGLWKASLDGIETVCARKCLKKALILFQIANLDSNYLFPLYCIMCLISNPEYSCSLL